MIKTITDIRKKFFLQKFIDDYRVGAVFPSSYFLIRKVTKLLPNNMSVVVEQGAGNGVMTRALLKKLKPDGKLYVVEQNQQFINLLEKISDPRLVLVRGFAQDFNYEQNLQGKKADLVITSIPFSFLKHDERNMICKQAYSNLIDGGMFIIFHQYSLVMENFVREYFKNVYNIFYLFNIPPCSIIVAKK